MRNTLLYKHFSVDIRYSNWFALQHWYRSEAGLACARTETELLATGLSKFYAPTTIALGAPGDYDPLAASLSAHCWRFDIVGTVVPTAVDALADPRQLPLPKNSVDVAVVPHVLEFTPEPYVVLREIDRVLLPDGRVVILGFSPLSLWYLLRLLRAAIAGLGVSFAAWPTARRRSAPETWRGRTLSVAQVRSWLDVLGIETRAVRYGWFPVTIGGVRVAGRCYLLLGKKKVLTLTPIGARWRPRSRLAVAGVAERARAARVKHKTDQRR